MMPDFNQYECQCAQCRKNLRDPADDPIYVVRLDEYFCDDKCWDVWRKENPMDRDINYRYCWKRKPKNTGCPECDKEPDTRLCPIHKLELISTQSTYWTNCAVEVLKEIKQKIEKEKHELSSSKK